MRGRRPKPISQEAWQQRKAARAVEAEVEAIAWEYTEDELIEQIELRRGRPISCGQRLYLAKHRFPHGTWQQFVRDRLTLSPATTVRYQKAFTDWVMRSEHTDDELPPDDLDMDAVRDDAGE